MHKILLLAALLLVPSLAEAKTYTVDPAKSKIAFNVTHSVKPVAGTFNKWEAKIDFDAANLVGSKIEAVIYTGMVKTGESIYDGTLPSSDWLDSTKFPKATFVSTSVEKAGADKKNVYVARGLLTLKGKSQPASLSFILTPADGGGDVVTAKGEMLLDRLALGVGVASDPKAQWVSKDIKLIVDITAKPQ